jgi:hypothetical protein
MSRNNKLLNMPITNACSGNGIKKFIGQDIFIGTDGDDEINNFIQNYKTIYNSIKDDLNQLQQLETVITQLRCQKQIKSEIKIYISQIYVYARSTFYRSDKQIKDIRVLLGPVSELGDDMDTLYNNEEFMNEAHNKLHNAMRDEIKDSIKRITLTVNKD